MGYALVGLQEIIEDFDKLIHFSDEMIDEMLNAGAAVMVAAEKVTANEMLNGPHSHAANPSKYPGPSVADSIAQGTIRETSTGRYTDVIFKGTQHGERLAAIAYINEFGKINQPARPFIATAVYKEKDAAVNAAARVYDEFLRQCKF